MAKKLYHLAVQKILKFIKHHKSTLCSDMKNSKKLEYAKRFGKASYLLEIERFLCFLKIDKNLDHALKLINYFESEAFIKELMVLMEVEHFYFVLQHLKEHEAELFSSFLQQSFMHFHTSQTVTVKIDHQSLAISLAKDKNIALKESFGEEEGEAYFRLFLDGEMAVERILRS